MASVRAHDPWPIRRAEARNRAQVASVRSQLLAVAASLDNVERAGVDCALRRRTRSLAVRLKRFTLFRGREKRVLGYHSRVDTSQNPSRIFVSCSRAECLISQSTRNRGHAVISLDGQASRTCEGISRREWLRVGGLGTLGLGLSDLVAGRAISGTKSEATSLPASSFGRAKSCIVLFMFGAPAHQDTWDLKPNAPSEVRGEFQPIASSVPDVFVSEHLPMLATRTDQFTQIRSVTHPDNVHTVAMHYMLTGRRHRRPGTNPQNASDDFPCFGSIANYVGSMATGQTPASSQSPSTNWTSSISG